LIRAHTERLAAEEGLEIEYVQRMKSFRKEDRVQQILTVRGNRPGLVHIFSAMEPCPDVRAVARQEDRMHLHSPRSRQVPALLLLLHRRDARALLSSRPDVVPVPRSLLPERARPGLVP
jgi:hypothetical protein